MHQNIQFFFRGFYRLGKTSNFYCYFVCCYYSVTFSYHFFLSVVHFTFLHLFYLFVGGNVIFHFHIYTYQCRSQCTTFPYFHSFTHIHTINMCNAFKQFDFIRYRTVMQIELLIFHYNVHIRFLVLDFIVDVAAAAVAVVDAAVAVHSVVHSIIITTYIQLILQHCCCNYFHLVVFMYKMHRFYYKMTLNGNAVSSCNSLLSLSLFLARSFYSKV